MNISRRTFCRGAAAVAGGCALPVRAADEKPIMKFGVCSDVHIGGRKEAPERLAFALNWLRERDVDAVLFSGDFVHSGLIGQMEQFAAAWYKAFPEGRGRDGRKVEIMLSTGNHEAAASWVKGKDEWRAKNVLAHGDNFAKTWKRLFNLDFDLVWRRVVKGVTFIGAQWPSLKPDLDGWMKAHAGEIDKSMPFFYCQHMHPKGTCHGSYAGGHDDVSVRVLSKFPNAVAISGHSHCSIADERTVWQGAFTSIGAGCLHEGGGVFSHENVTVFWYPPTKGHLMASLNDPAGWGGDPAGGCFELIEVYADHIVVHRRSSVCDAEIGPSWRVPVPARPGGEFDPKVRAAAFGAPEFAAGASVSAEVFAEGHALENPARRGEPCVRLAFPHPAGGRVFDYEVTAKGADGKALKRLVMAPGFASALSKSALPGECLFSVCELPAEGDVSFTVTPLNCFGRRGAPIACSLAGAAVFAPPTGAARSGRALVWHDEFDGNALDSSKWNFHQTMRNNDIEYVNDPRTVRVEDGCLHLRVERTGLPKGPTWRLSQGVTTRKGMGFRYGYLEMRAKVPFRHGAWPSFWAQSDPSRNNMDHFAEVDFFEAFSSKDSIAANLHKWKKGKHVMLKGGEGKGARSYRFACPEKLNDEFHVYGFEWNPREMAFYVDDRMFYSCPITEAADFSKKAFPGMACFHQHLFVIFNNEVFTKGSHWCPEKWALGPADPMPIDYKIDWIRLWQHPTLELLRTASPV